MWRRIAAYDAQPSTPGHLPPPRCAGACGRAGRGEIRGDVHVRLSGTWTGAPAPNARHDPEHLDQSPRHEPHPLSSEERGNKPAALHSTRSSTRILSWHCGISSPAWVARATHDRHDRSGTSGHVAGGIRWRTTGSVWMLRCRPTRLDSKRPRHGRSRRVSRRRSRAGRRRAM